MNHFRTRRAIVAYVLFALLGLSIWGSLVDLSPDNRLTLVARLALPLALIGLASWAGYLYLRPATKSRPVDDAVDDEPDAPTEELTTVETPEPTEAMPTVAMPVDTPEPVEVSSTIPRSRVMTGAQLRQSLLNIKRLLVWMTAVWLFLMGIALNEQFHPAPRTGWYVMIGMALVAVLGLSDIPLRRLLRKRHKDVSDGSSREAVLYQECPHFTLILKVTIIQITVWVLVLAASVAEHVYSGVLPLWVNLSLQWLVTIVNIYMIARRYVVWKGTTYTWTKNHYTVVHQRDVFFGLMNASSKSYVAGTLVRVEATQQGILEQPPLFERRGTATIRTQDETEPDIVVPYVYDPVRFREAGNLATSRS